MAMRLPTIGMAGFRVRSFMAEPKMSREIPRLTFCHMSRASGENVFALVTASSNRSAVYCPAD